MLSEQAESLSAKLKATENNITQTELQAWIYQGQHITPKLKK